MDFPCHTGSREAVAAQTCNNYMDHTLPSLAPVAAPSVEEEEVVQLLAYQKIDGSLWEVDLVAVVVEKHEEQQKRLGQEKEGPSGEKMSRQSSNHLLDWRLLRET